MPKLKLVLIEWRDAHSGNRWRNEDDVRTKDYNSPLDVSSVGWVMKRTKKGISIVGQHDELGSVAHCLFIPKACIKRVRQLKG